jgi:ketosteroid isomerase-like protein
MSEAIADRLAICDVMIKYATSVDALDMDRYATCFTDDVVVTGFGDATFNGLAEYMPWVTAARNRFGRTQHLLGNQVVVQNGDEATLRTYVQATHVALNDEDTLIILWGVYHDQLVRTADGWKITHHHLERLIEPRTIKAVRPGR